MPPNTRETRAVALSAAVLAVYALLVLASGKVAPLQLFALWCEYLAGAFALWVFLGILSLLAMLVAAIARGETQQRPLAMLYAAGAARWREDRLLSILWPPLLFATLMASFNAYKQKILSLAPFRFDDAFARLDQALFLGNDAWRVSHGLFASPAATRLIDTIYSGWVMPMVIGVVACAWLPRSAYRIRTQYLFAFVGVWILMGSGIAFLVPATGPIFAPDLLDPQSRFAELTQLLAAQDAALGGGQLPTLDHLARLMMARDADGLIIGGGISAMPSIHNAVAILFALTAFQVGRAAGAIWAFYAAAIWVGSIHMGWHYAIDGLFALPLTILIWWGAGHVVRWLEQLPDRTPATRPEALGHA